MGGSKYYPYGEEQQVTAQDKDKFATYYRDGTTGLDYAQNRYYANTLGRFTSPDPYVATDGSVDDPSDPQSWNRYAYVEGDPVNYYDPDGLLQACPEGTHVGADRKSCDPDHSTGPVKQPPKKTIDGPPVQNPPDIPPPGGGSDCPSWARRFFKNLDLYKSMSTSIGVDVNFIMALSALESHWDDTHAQDLGNLFGLTNAGRENLDFRNGKTISEQAGYQASANYWVNHYGDRVAGAASIGEFWSDLKGYNTKNPKYAKTISDVYDSVLQRRKDCDK